MPFPNLRPEDFKARQKLSAGEPKVTGCWEEVLGHTQTHKPDIIADKN